MCDPITALVAIGTGASILGQVKSGRAAEKAGNREKESYDKLASARLDKVKYDIKLATTAFNRKVGENVAQISQSGIASTSFYDVLADSENEFAQEKAAIRYTANAEASQLREQGRIAYDAGRDAKAASYIGAATTAIKGATSLYNPFQTQAGGWQTTTYNASGQII